MFGVARVNAKAKPKAKAANSTKKQPNGASKKAAVMKNIHKPAAVARGRRQIDLPQLLQHWREDTLGRREGRLLGFAAEPRHSGGYVVYISVERNRKDMQGCTRDSVTSIVTDCSKRRSAAVYVTLLGWNGTHVAWRVFFHLSADDILKLSISGEHWKVRRFTLCAVRGSVMELLFSGRFDDKFIRDRNNRIRVVVWPAEAVRENQTANGVTLPPTKSAVCSAIGLTC
ncbi:unnamed protein product [Vitrella brassicaformis CCMP3155]|uniref:Uncharacterized protein n=1 Tax=Vitrella brassicaformis (strain CCMP3155) TaxID=1169540 RepID=A0A0G4GMI1_VITBC|nr:unnamed protein product [Vitrella brassicaformis CCMP3155]|eukprot:CEM31412.1 unnamed protein product [Vitrella brassicaformis CCMP3155]